MRNASPRGPMCFRCLIFSLSGLVLFYCLLDLFVLCVACLTGFVTCLVKQFAICLGVFVILLLNVMELLSMVGCGLLDFCMSEVISSFRSLRAGSQMFALLMLCLCVILHTMSSGNNMQLLCIFPFGMWCLSAISMMFVNILLAVCMLVGMVV